MENNCKKRYYKTKFDNKELSSLNTIEHQLIRSRVMSTYAYLKKLIIKNEGTYSVSFKQLEKNYNKSHEPTTYRTLLTRINILAELGLIKKTVRLKGCTYELGTGVKLGAKKEKKYTNKDLEFSDKVINIFSTVENEKIRASAMSIYRYFKILVIENDGSVTISFQNFLKRYSYYDKKFNRKSKKIMTPQTFKTRVDLLIELGLITRTEYKKTFTYELALEVPPCLKENNDKDNNDDSNDSNNNDNDNLLPGNDNEEDITLDDSYLGKFNNDTNNEPISTTNFGEFISSADEAVEYVKNTAKKLKVRSKWVINSAIANIKSCYNKINKRGAFNYIAKTILKLQVISQQVYRNTKVYCDSIKKFREANKPKKKLAFNDFVQRDYDYDRLERILLGEEEGRPSECYIGESNPYDKDDFEIKNRFNNFTQRDCDYNKLEKDMIEKQNREYEERLMSREQEGYVGYNEGYCY